MQNAMMPNFNQWNEFEDALLKYLVTHNFVNWSKVSLHLPGRTATQCRERWIHFLDQTIDGNDVNSFNEGVDVSTNIISSSDGPVQQFPYCAQ